MDNPYTHGDPVTFPKGKTGALDGYCIACVWQGGYSAGLREADAEAALQKEESVE